jgi:hypothetical protein
MQVLHFYNKRGRHSKKSIGGTFQKDWGGVTNG